jgi:hypothetical protein
MSDKHEHGYEHREERKGEYTDEDGVNVETPEPEAGEYTDSEIPGDE